MRNINVSMRVRTRRSLFGFLLAATVVSSGQMVADRPDVHARLEASARATAGTTVPVVVEMTIGRGWHVNSHAPSEKYLIPTAITLTSDAGTLSAVRYPPDVDKRLSFSEHPLRIYEGTVTFKSDFHVPADASGRVRITGTAAYQACTDRQCYPPARLSLETAIQISPSESSR